MNSTPRRALILGLISALGLLLAGLPVFGKMAFQITPTVSISEEYNDNYLKTRTDKQEEFITSYAAGLTLSVTDASTQVYLSYTPTYRDYKNLKDRDSIDHVMNLEAQFIPAKHTELKAQVYYDGKTGDYEGESRERKASLSGQTQAGKHTDLSYSHRYSRRYEQQQRTGTYKEHTVNTSRMGLSHQYGKKDVIRADFTYESDDYRAADDDEYKKFDPSVTVSYWFSPVYGMEGNLDYTNKDFNLDANDEDTYSGHLKGIRSFSKHLDGYVKYRQYYTDTAAYTHHIFHPSLGVDWDVADDAGISIGLGLLFHDRSDDTGSSTDPFIDIDAFKRFEFSPQTTLTLTGSSDYESSGDDAASLGYQTSYRAGAVLSHQLLKQLGSNLFGSYTRIDFDDPLVSRKDDRATLGAGLTWTPLKWLRLALNYSFTDYRTTAGVRDDYRDNRLFFSVSLVPETPIRPDKEVSREAFEEQIYTPENYFRQ